MKTKISFLIILFVAAVFASCKKENTSSGDLSLNLADDDALSEAIFEDLFNTVDNASIALDDAMKNGDSKSSILEIEDDCPAVTVDNPGPGIWPKKIIIDYGDGCTGFHNHTRSGKIVIEVTGPRRIEGSKRTVSFDDYYFNDIKVEGIKVFENKGTNSNGNIVISAELTGGKLILPDGRTIEREGEHQREWITGFLTANKWDDECIITGSASGRNSDGVHYLRTIINGLHWKRVCAFIVSGVIEIERDGFESVLLDYGTGECDNKAVVTVGEESKEIMLRHRSR